MLNDDYISKGAALFKILGDETKLKILRLLSDGELNVSAIVERTGQEQSNVSHQLKVLKDNHLVDSRREGRSNVYFLDDHHVYSVLDEVFNHLKHVYPNE